MSDSHEFNESELEQVSGGTSSGPIFYCPRCTHTMTVVKTDCELHEAGPLCKCCASKGQEVRMIRIR